MQHRDQQQADRAREVDQELGLGGGEDARRVAQIGLDDGSVGVVVRMRRLWATATSLSDFRPRSDDACKFVDD
jgi:hypothetical protein